MQKQRGWESNQLLSITEVKLQKRLAWESNKQHFVCHSIQQKFNSKYIWIGNQISKISITTANRNIQMQKCAAWESNQQPFDFQIKLPKRTNAKLRIQESHQQPWDYHSIWKEFHCKIVQIKKWRALESKQQPLDYWIKAQKRTNAKATSSGIKPAAFSFPNQTNKMISLRIKPATCSLP